MFRIKANVSITEKAWGLSFIDGVATTEDEYLADRLKRKGYEVEAVQPAENPVAETPSGESNGLNADTPNDEKPDDKGKAAKGKAADESGK